MVKKKILFVASRQFWPKTGGKDITLYFDCKGLHEQYDYDIYLFCFVDKNVQIDCEKPSFIKDVVCEDVPSMKQSICGILKNSIFFKDWPFQNSLYYSSKISKRLLSYCNEVQPDIVFIDMVRLVPYAEDLLKLNEKSWNKIILIEDDLLAKRYRRQLEAGSKGNMAGQYSKNIPSLFNKISNISFVRKMILSIEAKRLERYEKDCIDKFDYITFISPLETDEFNKMYNTKKGITLTMGADVKYYSEGTSDVYKKNAISIVANFTTAANADSIEIICSKIIPELPEDIKYYVIGKCPDNIQKKYESEKIHFLGFVDDIRREVTSTQVFLSPISFGTGIKTKIVEAMAMGIPVVTNSVGAEGLDVEDGIELYIKDDYVDMVNIVKELLRNDALRKKIGVCGQKFVQQHHDWNSVYKAFEKMGL